MKLASEKMTSEMKSPFNNSTFHKISTIVPKERPGRSDENYF